MIIIFFKYLTRATNLDINFISFSIHFFSTNSPQSFIPIKIYKNADIQKQENLIENKGKSGIYHWVNNINGRSYVGFNVDLYARLNQHYYNHNSNISL